MCATGVSSLSKNNRHDTLKYEYVRRRTHDYFSDRVKKKLDKHWDHIKELQLYTSVLEDAIHVLEAEIEGIRLDKTSVRIAGRRDALKEKV